MQDRNYQYYKYIASFEIFKYELDIKLNEEFLGVPYNSK